MTAPSDFWSRRRAAVEAEEAALADDALARDVEMEAADQSDEEILAALDLPDPDTMKQGDDFSAFMAKAVPDRIRRRALRKLWLSNPALANLDELLDYGEDFTDKAMVVENMQTAYQVGKGMLKHVEEMARQAAERDAETETDETPDDDTAPEDMIAAATETEVEVETAPLPAFDVAEDAPVPTPRRMQFQFETDTA